MTPIRRIYTDKKGKGRKAKGEKTSFALRFSPCANNIFNIIRVIRVQFSN
jgi:hypothetical protein